MYRTRSRDKPTKIKGKLISSKHPLTDLSGTWTEKEEKALYYAIEDPNVEKSWEMIIEKIRTEIQDFNHKPEECVQYYKNFINPSWYNENWPIDKGFFLSMFARVYGYNWTKLADLLQEKNPSTLKNYFYSLLRKVVKHAGSGYIPLSVLDKVANFFEWMQVLDEVRIQCFRTNRPNTSKQLADWIVEAKLNGVKFREYRETIIKRFCATQGEGKLPITLMVDLEKAEVKGADLKALLEAEESISAVTKDLVIIQFPGHEKTKVPPKVESFKFPVYRSMLPVHIGKRIFPEPLIYQSVHEYLPSLNFGAQQVQPNALMSPHQDPPHEQRKHNLMNNGDN